MSVTLLNVDVSDKILERGSSSASLDDVTSILVQARDYVIADNAGEFNPFASAGLLFRNSWRNETIKETEVNSREIFTGGIKRVGMRLDQSGFQTIVSAREPIGTLLDFVVEENLLNPGWVVDTSASIGDQIIRITDGITTPAIPSQISFSDDLVPRYQIQDTAALGGGKFNITLDRPLEIAISPPTPVRISNEVFKTSAGALSDALVSIGLGAQIGSSFALIDTQDTAAAQFIRLHIRTEDNITLASHIKTLLDLGNLSLTVNSTGVLDVVRNIAFDGRNIIDAISADEVLDPLNVGYDDSKLIIGYDLLFASGETVQIASNDIDQSLINEYAGLNRWQPLDAKSSLVMDYQYLYNTNATAAFFGDLRLNYYGAPRVRVRCGLKQAKADQILNRFQIQLAKDFTLTMPISANQSFLDEPVRVVGFNFNEAEKRYDSIDLELTNFPLPNLPRSVSAPTSPVIIELFGINNGITTVFEPLGTDLFIQITLEDKLTIVIDTQVTFFTQGDGNDVSIFQSVILNNGIKYFVRYRAKENNVFSDFTEFEEFIPTSNGPALWGSGSAWGVKEWS